MEFIRENILKIIMFIVILFVAIIIFTFVFAGKREHIPTSYSSMEDSMKNGAIKYVSNNKNLLPKNENESSKVNLDTLINAEILSNFNAIEDNNVSCNGYVDILYKNNDYVYVPHLKCGEFYETTSIADYIKNNETIVTSSDGLYKMGDSFVYRGESPNNYIQLGNRLYRIIEIKENELRLIINSKINASIVWDDRYNAEKNTSYGLNTYSKSRLKDSLNEIALNKPLDNEEVLFSDQEMQKFIEHDICTGKRSSNYDAIDPSNECQTVEPNQKIGLLTVSDYARASIDTNCTTIYSKSCINYNYFNSISSTFYTMTASSDNSYEIFKISDGVAELSKASRSFYPYIVVKINELSLYDKGNGTKENPYIVR